MARVRVYELAKELGVESKVVMAQLQQMGVLARSAASTIEAQHVRELVDVLSASGQARGSARTAPASHGRADHHPGKTDTPSAAVRSGSKTRVYELANEFEVESKVVMAKLQEIGEYVRSASSTLEPPVESRLREALARPVAPRTVTGPTASPGPRGATTSREAPTVPPTTPRPRNGTPVPSPSDVFAKSAGTRAGRPREVPHQESAHPRAAGEENYPPNWVAKSQIKPLRRFDPTTIGTYSVLGRLGRGGMGQVYLGRSRAGRLAAIKVIKEEFAGDREFRKRFVREVSAAKSVSGVYTAAVIAEDAEAEMPWLATAYISAPSLEDLVTTCGPLPVKAARWLAAGVIEALESIHDAGIIHRDLKPSNVLVALDGPRVIDFGLAQAAASSRMTASHATLGTPAYMSPEQVQDSRRVTTASDVYSLGSLLVYATTGHTPYPGESPWIIFRQLLDATPDLSGLPHEIEGIVRSCMRPDPARRPSLGELLAELTRHLRPEHLDTYSTSTLLPRTAYRFLKFYDARQHEGNFLP
ncbi:MULTISPECIES: translation initiation factor IF-2 N-terminal domain-containing protein [unclassified Streptomyces]|uniref:translation initiation factor IF-2 N-terminal domain-containing protein n=1 Tax=unclassified Streptomyces TaxID=2593676 RepID=UPI0037F96237